MRQVRELGPFTGLLLLALTSCWGARLSPSPIAIGSQYNVIIDEHAPDEAVVTLVTRDTPPQLQVARDGDGGQMSNVQCADGRALSRTAKDWRTPAGCRAFRWTVRLEPVDGRGLDASMPRAASSHRHRYWLLPERAALLRASSGPGAVRIRLRLKDGQIIARDLAFPSNDQPPFYAVIGARPAAAYSGGGVALRVFGKPPDYPWMADLHGRVLAAWSRWRRDLVVGDAPSRIDWAWIEPKPDLEPGYNASAGADSILSQIKLRPGDPEAEAKARAAIGVSAAHEGFHTITGAAGQAWPAWVNESLANHFAIEAARGFLAPDDFRFVHAFYIAPDVKVPLLQAQEAYGKGDGAQGQVFYTYGARFWRAIEQVLTNPPNPSGRLAALIKASRNFEGVELNDAAALGSFLDRYSQGRAAPIVRCFLLGTDCRD